MAFGVSRAATLPCLSNQAFCEWCFVVTPGACSKADPTLPPLGYFGVGFFGFLGSRPDRFCPFAIVTSNHDCPWIMMRCPRSTYTYDTPRSDQWLSLVALIGGHVVVAKAGELRLGCPQ